MSVMERDLPLHQQYSKTTSISERADCNDMVTSNPSRRSIDWRDSGIVIDEDYQFNFSSFEALQQQSSSGLNLSQSGGQQSTQQIQTRYSAQHSLPQVTTGQPICPSQKYVLDQDDDGDTVLHLAVVGCQLEKVRDLIKISNINAINNMMQTPLHMAVLANRTDMVDLLVKTPNIKLDCLDRRGNTPIHLACKMGEKNIVETLLESIKDNGQICVLKDMIEQTNFDGQTCLHLAAMHNHPNIIEILVKSYQADLNFQDSKSGQTSLHMAISKLNVDMVKLILHLSDQHVDQEQRHFNRADYSGRGPLEMVRIMLESRQDDLNQVERLRQISQLVSDRIRLCSNLGCHQCSSSKSEKNLKLLTLSQQGLSIDNDDVDSSPPSSFSSDYSDSDDYEMN